MSIALTERAARKIQNVFREHDMPETACLRVGIKGGGCAGFSYTLDVTDAPAEDDDKFVSHDVTLVCDPKSHLYLNGTEIDYSDDLLKGGFVFHNPNAKNSCGCGSSFSA
jgi:iron-sulfur cluster assembly protein